METWNYFLVFFIGSALMATTFIIYIARAYKKNYELRKEMGLNYQDAVAMIKSYFEENPDIKKAQFARQHNLNYTALRMIIVGLVKYALDNYIVS